MWPVRTVVCDKSKNWTVLKISLKVIYFIQPLKFRKKMLKFTNNSWSTWWLANRNPCQMRGGRNCKCIKINGVRHALHTANTHTNIFYKTHWVVCGRAWRFSLCNILVNWLIFQGRLARSWTSEILVWQFVKEVVKWDAVSGWDVHMPVSAKVANSCTTMHNV